MAQLLANRPGRAAYVPDAMDIPMRLRVDDWDGLSFRAVIGQVAVQRSGNFQLMHTFDDVVYAFVFGDRVGQLQISGLAFPDTCGAGGGPTGIEHVLEFYERNRAAARAAPMTIQIGTSTGGHFRGLLAQLQADISSPESRICRFALSFRVIPRAI